ncbi:pyridoxal phosphate-dependent decarboxylase family protein [Flaviflexus massiliensis]|uniref:pyridoxal phosphate-dependent decarboxylase family protein n=1 Tax=Flaviflexus massiliensis TaxID=1522309 RepID=UPI000A44BF87|nr:aminotransferase class V-fold PLP-dependent enzyme [Flaviflexus massiliensis]
MTHSKNAPKEGTDHSTEGTDHPTSASRLDAWGAAIIEELARLRQGDAPTHGGRVLSYVYDHGSDSLDALAGRAMEMARPLNGLDPLTFTSIAAMERDLLRFAVQITGGTPKKVSGSIASGGTESCLLAVGTARDLWRAEHPNDERTPRLVTTSTVHAAFQKAARIYDMAWDPVPVRPDGSVDPQDIIVRLGDDVALVVMSSPAYPTGVIDPIEQIAHHTEKRGISLHVDACFGGLILPWWQGAPKWDFRVPGVTGLGADFHKYGYAPKGVSVLLHRGRKRHRRQFFATTSWPAYPVVDPTFLGSKSASPLAAAWAVTSYLGEEGYAEGATSCQRSVNALRQAVDSIEGLTVWGHPTGPALALIADTSVPSGRWVDPHRLADDVTKAGFQIQHQPGYVQADGTILPRSVHLTITPVTEKLVPELTAALISAAHNVQGKKPHQATALGRIAGWIWKNGNRPSPSTCRFLLKFAGSHERTPQKMAPLMAIIEALPAPVAEALVTEMLAMASEP